MQRRCSVQRALRQADLLVSTALDATLVRNVARRLGKPAITVALRRELMDEMTRQRASGPLYLIGSDPRFRDAVRRVFAPIGSSVTARWPRRVTPIRRVFSRDMAREILTFIVRSTIAAMAGRGA